MLTLIIAIVLYVMGGILCFFLVGPDEDERGPEWLLSWLHVIFWPISLSITLVAIIVESIRNR